MKRVIKNVVCLLSIIAIICSIFLTINIAKNELSNNTVVTNQSMNYKNQLQILNNIDQNANGEIPPEKPEGENFNNENGEVPPEKIGETNENSEEPPEKPSGDGFNNEDGNTPPDKPSDENENSEGQASLEKPGENSNELDFSNNIESEVSKSIPTKYLIAFTLESLLLSLIIVYLVQSNFNKKTIRETYSFTNKIVFGFLATIILSTALTYGILYITNNYFLKNNTAGKQLNDNGSNNNSSNSNITYSESSKITESSTLSNVNYESETANENALSIDGDINVTIDNTTVTKTGDSNGGDDTSFYGINSAIIAKNGANLTITNANITTDATGANGIFSYGGTASTQNATGDGTTINISDSTIITKKDSSGGIMTTGGGITNASNLTIETSGTSSAAIRTDRGGGEVNVDGGTYTTNGSGSPTIYSTADVTVKNAKLISNTSEGVIVEGKNSVVLENVLLTDTNNKLNGQSTTYKNIFLYQSMSGDADDGTSKFTSTNSTITTNKGDTLYVTNTTAIINLTNNTIINNDSTGNFIRVGADSWGKNGSNGGDVTLTMTNQIVSGNIVIDSISTLDLTLSNSSNYTGSINSDNTAKSISITLDKSSTIKLTGDSYITSLNNSDSTNSNIDFNGYKLYVNGISIN